MWTSNVVRGITARVPVEFRLVWVQIRVSSSKHGYEYTEFYINPLYYYCEIPRVPAGVQIYMTEYLVWSTDKYTTTRVYESAWYTQHKSDVSENDTVQRLHQEYWDCFAESCTKLNLYSPLSVIDHMCMNPCIPIICLIPTYIHPSIPSLLWPTPLLNSRKFRLNLSILEKLWLSTSWLI